MKEPKDAYSELWYKFSIFEDHFYPLLEGKKIKTGEELEKYTIDEFDKWKHGVSFKFSTLEDGIKELRELVLEHIVYSSDFYR